MHNIINFPNQKNKKSNFTKIYQFKVRLENIRPYIWRKIQVKNNINLKELHLYLNDAMGWYNCHLHEFVIDGASYGMLDPELEFDDRIIDEEKIKINQIITYEKQDFTYVYDFGDGWEHTVILEKILDIDPNVKYPKCIAGARACPPEDCGNYPGYKRICEIMKDPTDPEYESTLEWLCNKKYNPEEFDLLKADVRVKQALRTAREMEKILNP